MSSKSHRPMDYKSSSIIGTPLPEIKNDEDMTRKEKIEKNKYQPVWNQNVYDEQGRRRFHGAFKGGWSAGYFNSVGSKEGFTSKGPMVSSRSKRAKIPVQRVEDIMDEEDREELGLGERNGLMTNSVYSTGSIQNFSTDQSPIPGLSQEDFIGYPSNSIGVKLLKLMGWKESRSIGLKLKSHKKRKRHYGVTGLTLMEMGQEDESDDDMDDFEKFNSDIKVAIVKSKDNFYGIGFDPYRQAPEFRSKRKTDSETNKNSSRIEMSDIIATPKVALDLYQEFEDEEIQLPSTRQRTVEKKMYSTVYRGFVKATKTVSSVFFEPPELPRDYTPAKRPGQRVNAKKSLYKTIGSQERSKLLGEKNAWVKGPVDSSSTSRGSGTGERFLSGFFASKFHRATESIQKPEIDETKKEGISTVKGEPRKVISWDPDPLFCKRMGINVPKRTVQEERY